MENIKDKIKNDRYRNWVKSTLGLEQTNRAVYEYVKEKFRLYTHGNAQGLNPTCLFTQQELSHISVGAGSSFRKNISKSVQYDKHSQTYNWKKSKTNNCVECKTAFEKVLLLHNNQSGSILHWANSDDTSNISLEWAIAKMFMPQGNDERNNNGPEDTDPYAMFHTMHMCLLFRNPIRISKLEELKKTRNTLFHSSDNAVSDADVKKYFKSMNDLLKDASNDRDVDQRIRDVIVDDIKKLEKLQEGEMTMTLFDDALKLKRKAIYYDFEKSLCENDPDTLKELLDLAERTVEDIQELKKHAHEVKYIEKYKSVMDYCRRETKQLSNELNELKKGIRAIPILCDEMKRLEEKVGEWRRALRYDISQLEVDGIFIVVVVTIFISLILRVCVYFA